MSTETLARECEVFTRYLTGRGPTPYVSGRYAAAHAVLGGMEPADGHGRWLLRVSQAGPVACRVADAWARIAAPRSVLRRKLVVLLAILEVSPPFAAVLDQPGGRRTLEWARIAGSGVTTVVALAVGLVLFLPVRLAAGGRDQ